MKVDFNSILAPTMAILSLYTLQSAATAFGKDIYETAKGLIERLIKLNNKQAEPYLNRLNANKALSSEEVNALLIILDNISINATEIARLRDERIKLDNKFYDVLIERLDFQQVKNVMGRLGLDGRIPDKSKDELARGIVSRTSTNQRFGELVEAIIIENPQAFY